jgi:hypothetical protein
MGSRNDVSRGKREMGKLEFSARFTVRFFIPLAYISISIDYSFGKKHKPCQN